MDKHMIGLTRINRVPLVLNTDLIEHVETTPDTVIAMTNGQAIASRPEAMAAREQISEEKCRGFPHAWGQRLAACERPATNPNA